MKIKLNNPKIDKTKETLFFSGILAIIIVILWIEISVYSAYNQHEPDKEMNKLLTPINPTLDLEVLREYRDSRVSPPQEFDIMVVEKEGQEINSYSLNPFTNTTNQVIPPTAEEEPINEPVEESTEEFSQESVEEQ